LHFLGTVASAAAVASGGGVDAGSGVDALSSGAARTAPRGALAVGLETLAGGADEDSTFGAVRGSGAGPAPHAATVRSETPTTAKARSIEPA
jgi:hypothetical protein